MNTQNINRTEVYSQKIYTDRYDNNNNRIKRKKYDDITKSRYRYRMNSRILRRISK
jgi:hypothetical protein